MFRDYSDTLRNTILNSCIKSISSSFHLSRSVISLSEFLGQYHDETNPPKWVIQHREDYHNKFDLNKDGKMDREEARKWVLPERNESQDETKHLMEGTDENADRVLSVDEILLHWNLFVGSQATDHGRTLRKIKREEL